MLRETNKQGVTKKSLKCKQTPLKPQLKEGFHGHKEKQIYWVFQKENRKFKANNTQNSQIKAIYYVLLGKLIYRVLQKENFKNYKYGQYSHQAERNLYRNNYEYILI